jgi:hypothetical protein
MKTFIVTLQGKLVPLPRKRAVTISPDFQEKFSHFNTFVQNMKQNEEITEKW